MHGRREDDPLVGLIEGVEGPHYDVSLFVNSSDEIDKSGLVVFLGIERRLIINATDQMKSNGIHLLKGSIL